MSINTNKLTCVRSCKLTHTQASRRSEANNEADEKQQKQQHGNSNANTAQQQRRKRESKYHEEKSVVCYFSSSSYAMNELGACLLKSIYELNETILTRSLIHMYLVVCLLTQALVRAHARSLAHSKNQCITIHSTHCLTVAVVKQSDRIEIDRIFLFHKRIKTDTREIFKRA